MGRVLLTGANGFIGRNVQRPLLDQGLEVHAVYRGNVECWALPEVETHRCDLFHKNEVETLMNLIKPSHLLHLAWYMKPHSLWDSPENEKCVEAALDLQEKFAHHGGKRAVFVGSCAEYDWHSGPCHEQTTLLNPQRTYGRAKVRLQKALLKSAAMDKISTSWARLFYLYGPHESEVRLVPAIAKSLLLGQETPCSDGQQRRDYLHVADAGKALVDLLVSDLKGPINIASGYAPRVADIIEKIAQLTNGAALVKWGVRQRHPGEPECIVADTSRLREELRFEPRHSLDSGLEDVVRWWREKLENST